jgi:CRISPR-associated protein Csa2
VSNKDAYISIALRLAAESEALNMIGSAGTQVLHRKSGILVQKGKGWRILEVPAVSGQSLAWGYHRALKMLAENSGMPLCDDCRNQDIIGGFIKRASQDPRSFKEKEFEVIKTCVIEDITGFMIVGKRKEKAKSEKAEAEEEAGGEEEEEEAIAGLRRTSPVRFSYMIPDPTVIGLSIIPQDHVRYNNATNEHTLFSIENAATIYTLGIEIDVKSIGRAIKPSDLKKPNEIVIDTVSDRDKRIALAIEALESMFIGGLFGAKRSRNSPRIDIIGGIAAISKPLPYMLPPSVRRGDESYVARAVRIANMYVENLKKLGIFESILIAYFDMENIVNDLRDQSNVEKVKDFNELIKWLHRNILGA